MLLQDGKFKKADKYFERVLDVNPREAKAHLGKFMVENEITSTANIPISEIKRNIGIFSFEEKIEDNQHFARAREFADAEFKKELEDCILHAKEVRYKSASDYMKRRIYSLAIKKFEQAGDYKDSQEQIKICHEKIEAENKEKLNFKITKEKEIIRDCFHNL